MSIHTRWVSADTWVCSRHLPSVRMAASVGVCAFAACDSTRPRRESFDSIVNTASKPAAISKPAAPQPTKSAAPKQTAPKKEAVVIAESTSETVEKCEWFKCNKGPNGEPAKSRERSKYCSRACSNSSARHRHKMRAKGLAE